jgi:hypothetical protein
MSGGPAAAILRALPSGVRKRGAAMHFEERDQGDYRIYTMATPQPRGGFIAGVVVKRRRADSEPECVFINRRLSAGYRFATVDDALQHAMEVGAYAVTMQISAA